MAPKCTRSPVRSLLLVVLAVALLEGSPDLALALDGPMRSDSRSQAVTIHVDGPTDPSSTDAAFGALPGDCDGDGDVDLQDLALFVICLTGPNQLPPAQACECLDLDQDGDVDLLDATLLASVFTGSATTADAAQSTAAALDLAILANGSSFIVVSPAEEIQYQITGVLTGDANQGLAFFGFDLAFSGGDLSPATVPTSGALVNFVAPQGLNNPAGYGGTLELGMLLQVGGGQNVFNNTLANAPFPVGPVELGVAQTGTPEVLVTGLLVAPDVEGTYVLELSNAFGSVIRDGETGEPYWATDLLAGTSVTNLTVQVGTSPATGACCQTGGTCTILTAGECDALGADYKGDLTTCEGDADADTVDGLCGDQCPNDAAKTEPGICGCGASEGDTDGDGVPDCVDVCAGQDDLVDTNNNGTPDCLEQEPVPAVTSWGVLILIVALLTGGKICFGRRGNVVAKGRVTKGHAD